jgi:ABC-type ATPase with predicted acetyltransferase domain
MTWQISRVPNARPLFPMLGEMWMERGSREDWDALAQLHYKAEGRIAGPRFYRCMVGTHLVGVAVMTYPRGMLRDRHRAMPGMRPEPGHDTHITNVYRFKWLNKEFGLNARTVNDTLFRGVGVGYRMLNLAARMDGRKFCEIQSSMSKFNQFAHKAGFRFIRPEPKKLQEPALRLYARWFDSKPSDWLAMLEELEAMPAGYRERVLRDLREFYHANSALEQTGRNMREQGVAHVEQMPARTLLKNLNQLVFSSPLYGIYKNPDFGRLLPDRIPLTAFDWQRPDEALCLERLVSHE